MVSGIYEGLKKDSLIISFIHIPLSESLDETNILTDVWAPASWTQARGCEDTQGSMPLVFV